MNKKMLGSLTPDQENNLKSHPFGDAISYWVELNESGVLVSTQADRKYRLKITQKILNNCPTELRAKTLAMITHADLVAMYKVLKTGNHFKMKVTTRKKWQQFITGIFNHLMALGVITKNPTYAWQRETGRSVPYPMVDPLVLKQIISYKPDGFADRSTYLFILLALETGMRLDNLVNLSIDDLVYGYDAQGKKIIVEIRLARTKYGSNYRAAISLEVSARILDYLENDRNKLGTHPNLFLTGPDHPLTRRYASERLSDFCTKLGIQHISPHMLRATFATYLAERTNNVRVIMDALGISDEGTAIHYIREAEKFRNRTYIRENSIVATILSSLNNEDEVGKSSSSPETTLSADSATVSQVDRTIDPATNVQDIDNATLIAQTAQTIINQTIPLIVQQVTQQMISLMMVQQTQLSWPPAMQAQVAGLVSQRVNSTLGIVVAPNSQNWPIN